MGSHNFDFYGVISYNPYCQDLKLKTFILHGFGGPKDPCFSSNIELSTWEISKERKVSPWKNNPKQVGSCNKNRNEMGQISIYRSVVLMLTTSVVCTNGVSDSFCWQFSHRVVQPSNI